MEQKPYFCPSCHSNRFKFSQLTQFATPFLKDAVSGEILEQNQPYEVLQDEIVIQCRVCQYASNEARFIRQAEMVPRHPSN